MSYVGGARQGVPVSRPYKRICGLDKGGVYEKQRPMWAGEDRCFRSHGQCCRSKTLSCSKQALEGHVWAGKRRLSETAPHVCCARQGVPVSMPYMFVCGGNGGGSVTMPCAVGQDNEFQAVRPTSYTVAMQSLASRHEAWRSKAWRRMKSYRISSLFSSTRTGGSFITFPFPPPPFSLYNVF